MSSFSGGAFGGGEIDLSSIENALQSSRYIGHGSIDVEFPDNWYLQDTDGEFITDTNGNKIFVGSPDAASVHGLGGYTNPCMVDTDGNFLLDTQDSAHPHYQTPLLEPNWRLLLVDGIATQLDTLETTVQYVTIQAKFTNLGKIWIGNSLVQRDRGIHLLPNHPPITLNIDDLRKIYIIGNAGEGVTFLYGTNEDIFLTTPGGDFVTTPGGDQIG